MGGLEALTTWLHCRLFLTNFRPVPLTEHAVFQGVVFRKVCAMHAPHPHVPVPLLERSGVSSHVHPPLGACTCAPSIPEEHLHCNRLSLFQGHGDTPLEPVRQIDGAGQGGDRDGLIALVADCVAEGGSVLVFCRSRASCQTTAALLAELLPARLGLPVPVRLKTPFRTV